jgi:hypothetical protein
LRGWYRFFRLTPADRGLLFEAALVLVAMRAGLAFLSFGRLLRIRARLEGKRLLCRAPLESSRIVWAVEAMSRSLRLTGCLVRALAADSMLVRRQQSSRLRLGVVKRGDALEAHAWLESDDRIIIGADSRRSFTPLVPVGLFDS